MTSGNTTAAAAAPDGGGVVLLREVSVVDVAAFVAAAGTEEEIVGEDRPEIVFSQIDPIGLSLHYADFNIRSRHFRVLESFFVDAGADGRIRAVVGTTGLKRDRRVLNVQLVVLRRGPEEDVAARLRALLAGVFVRAREFAPAVRKLRFTFVLDPSFGGALGAQVSRVLVEGWERVGLVEEARMANETGPGREAVLLAFVPGGGETGA
jgi:hypothetical protein